MQRIYLMIFTTTVAATVLLILLYMIMFDDNTRKPLKSLRNQRWNSKDRGVYEVIEGSVIESQFMALKVKNCSRSLKQQPLVYLNNKYWQVVDDGKVFLYSGFYDARFVYLKTEYHYVRLIGMAVGKIDSRKYHCSLWYKQLPNLIIIEAEAQEIWLQQWNPNPEADMHHAYLFTCPIPLEIKKKGIFPEYVSLSSKICENLTTKLPLKEEVNVLKQRKQKSFVVCVKGMDFAQDLSVRLVEWLELLFILGADKVFFYKYSLHKNMERVLEYYEKMKKVEVVPLTLPGDQPNNVDLRRSYLKRAIWQKRRNELVPYNDCLYRNMYDYEYIIPLDIDEVIMPIKSHNWSSLLDTFRRENPKWFKKYPSFSAQNAYFLDVYNSSLNPKIPPYYIMLQSKLRSANYSLYGHSVKSFVSTSLSKIVFNHYTLESLYAVRKTSLVMNASDVQLNHYKKHCPREIYSQCLKNFLVHIKRDDTIDRYQKPLLTNAEYVIRKLNLFS
ncbi:uncharacterized protein [Palaemon carinicauda]|uniref:uncharacterized protein n=1 Tax=Palaemon carinicauda TaxID=392227 RepID=UPI0035B5EC3F